MSRSKPGPAPITWPRACRGRCLFRWRCTTPFFREDRPNVLVEIGTPFSALDLTPGRLVQECRAAAERAAEAAQRQDLTGFAPLFRSRLTINKKWEWLQFALRGRLREFDPAN